MEMYVAPASRALEGKGSERLPNWVLQVQGPGRPIPPARLDSIPEPTPE